MKVCAMRFLINEGEIQWGLVGIKAASGDQSDPTSQLYYGNEVLEKPHYLERQRSSLMH